MVKRRISEYSGLAILAVGIILLFMRLFWGTVALIVLWYALYGFVGLAFISSSAQKNGLSGFFLAITFSPTLLPFRKAFYFWTKAIDTAVNNPDETEKVYDLAKKVNIDNLYTDNNKAIFYSFLASVHADLGNIALAKECVQLAWDLPNKEILNEKLDELYGRICEMEEVTD